LIYAIRVVILLGMYVRLVKVPSSNGRVNEYVRVVEAYREGGKVKQRVVADLGRKDLLLEVLPGLRRLLLGEEPAGPGEEDILDASTWGPVLVVRALFEELGLWAIFDRLLGRARGNVSSTDRAFVLLANRLIRPKSEHGLAGWLETDYVCTRDGRRFVPNWFQQNRVRVHHRQLDAWYRTLDRLVAAKSEIEVALYHRLRDLFHLRPEFVLYDLTSVYFEGAADPDIAKHGYSRDGKPQNVQVLVGVVMVAGWPIAHHVFAGNRKDASTVEEVLADLKTRFGFQRVVFVGDRGMVSDEVLTQIKEDQQGFLVGIKRRRNPQLNGWLEALDESKWQTCEVGITARERKSPPETKVQEVESGEENLRVFVIDSEDRRQYEQAQRERSMNKTREALERLQARVAAGRLVRPEKIGAAAARVLSRHKGSRYYDWRLRDGAFEFLEHPTHLDRERRLEGRYVIATSEPNVTALDAVAKYKELMEVERGFRHLKDVIALRPIHHRTANRIEAHIFVATLALLLERLLERRLKEANVDLSAASALEAASTIRLVQFHVPDGPPRQGTSRGSPRAAQVLSALKITDRSPPPPPEGQETVM
jgi:transposase